MGSKGVFKPLLNLLFLLDFAVCTALNQSRAPGMLAPLGADGRPGVGWGWVPFAELLYLGEVWANASDADLSPSYAFGPERSNLMQ